jgi:hypothetical protein
METPQVVKSEVLRRGLAIARERKILVTDCLAAAELAGVQGVLVDSGEPNLKITVPSDWDGRRTIQHIGGAESVHAVYVNGEFVGYGTDSRLASEYDITPFVHAGTNEVGKTAVALPMLVFFMQFILPPLAIAYTLWFVITYWPYVYAALWGWFLAMYDYFTSLVQGKMGC